jgi:hypothetical protein
VGQEGRPKAGLKPMMSEKKEEGSRLLLLLPANVL